MIEAAEYISGVTTHRRRGNINHRFSYRVDFVLIDPEEDRSGPALFSRNRFNLASVHDIDHGGNLKNGRGASWARDILTKNGFKNAGTRLLLLTQPRMFGRVFNPVSFWLAFRDDELIAVIAEVSTPFGDRHSYLCNLPDFSPIEATSQLTATKALHVSPFQDIEGDYEFRFDLRRDRIAIRIIHRNGSEGVVATLSGPRQKLNNTEILYAFFRRPLGGARTVFLIHWQALRLKLKGARYRPRPKPPTHEVSHG